LTQPNLLEIQRIMNALQDVRYRVYHVGVFHIFKITDGDEVSYICRGTNPPLLKSYEQYIIEDSRFHYDKIDLNTPYTNRSFCTRCLNAIKQKPDLYGYEYVETNHNYKSFGKRIKTTLKFVNRIQK
jgi:hypothetical protein